MGAVTPVRRSGPESALQDRRQPGDEPVHVSPGRVMDERGAHDTFSRVDTQCLHEAVRVEITVAYADVETGQCLRHLDG